MANYYVDSEGNITSDKKKKKKKKSQSAYTVSLDGTVTRNDIAPLKVTATTKKKTEKKKDDRTWLQKGAFDDGYQFGDFAKSILGTVADVGEHLTSGVLNMGETAIDSLAAFSHGAHLSNQANTMGYLTKEDFETAEQIKKDSEKFIKKDLYDSEKIAKKIITENVETNWGIDVGKTSVLGEKSDSLVESAGQLGATALLSPIVPWYLTTGLTSFGGEMENALNNGADYGEAMGSSLISTGAEILTEKLSGGISFGGKTLDEGMTRLLAKKIAPKGLRALSKVVTDFGGEGLEEVASSFFSRLGTALYKEDDLKDIIGSEEAFDEYLESFIGGGILGGVSSSVNVGKSALKGTDVLTGYTKNEQAVFDKVVENRIKELEESGKKVTSRDKSKIYEQVERDIERGNIDIDTIESVLGGETLEKYNSIEEQEKSLTKQLEELKEAPNTLGNAKQYEAIENQLNELKNNSNKTQIKEQLSKEVYDLTLNDTRLQESYKERDRKGQQFAADLNKYEGKQREMIQKAIDSGILNNTNKTHDFVDLVSKLSAETGVSFDFTNNERLKETGFALKGKTINGYVKDGNIAVNIDSNKALNTVVGHEITHVLEGTELYAELQSVVKQYSQTKGEYQSRYDELAKLYKGVKGANVESELTAELIGEYVFTDEDFVRNLSSEKPSVFQKVFKEIKYLYKQATAGSKEERQLEKVKKTFEKVYQEASSTREYSDTETKFSIREEAPPKETGVAYKVFYVKDGKLYPPMVANPDGADTPIGVWLNADVGTSAPPSKTGRPQVKAGGKGTQGGSGSLAFRPGWHLGDLPRASQFDRVNPETGKKELFPENFVWAEVEYAKDVDYQEEAMSYGYTDNGKFRHAYAGLPRLPENGYYRYRTNPKPDTVPWVITGAMKVNRLLSDSEVNAILEKNGVEPVHRQGGDVGLDKFGFKDDGTVKYSLTDSDGKELSKEQQEYFKDSKIRDDNGNLKVMYHGTSKSGFYVFDKEYSDDEISLFFTDKPTVAKGYSGSYSEYAPKKMTSIEEANAEIENDWSGDGYYIEQRGKDYVLYYEGDELDRSNSLDELIHTYHEGYGSGYRSTNYKVYLNIKNPLIIDAQNNNWDEIPVPENLKWRLGDEENPDIATTRDFSQFANEHFYDGVIFKNIVDNGVYASGMERFDTSTVAIAFNSNQIKSVTNQNPTENEDIRFSLSEEVEQGRELVAVHNLSSSKLMKTLELGAFPMPSIAVTKTSLGHSDFGDISFVFSKDTINPSNKKNKVYGADAWTPTFPRVEYEPDMNRIREIKRELKPLIDKIPERMRSSADSFTSALEYTLDSYGGYEGVVEKAIADDGMKQIYLAKTGDVVEDVIVEKRTEMSNADITISKNIAESLGSDIVTEIAKKSGKDIYEEHGEQIEEALKQSYIELGIDEDVVQEVIAKTNKFALVKHLRLARDYIENGGTKVETSIDYNATRNAISSKIDKAKYEQWVRDTFEGIVKNQGIYNGKDIYTPSGSRRSFSQTHMPLNAENVVKSMLSQGDVRNVAGFNGIKSIRAVAVKEFKNIDDIRKSSEKLKNIDSAEYEAINEALSERLYNVIGNILDSSNHGERNRFIAMDSVGEVILEACKKPTIANIRKTFDKYVYKVTDEQVKEIKDIIDEVIDMPVNMFEAKPLRTVAFDEAEAVIVPSDIDSNLLQELKNRGLNIVEYEAGNEADRMAKLNELDDLKFSLGEDNRAGQYKVYGKDIALESALEKNQKPFADDYAPLTEEQANVRDDRQVQEHYFPDFTAPEVEEEYNGEFADHITPDDPFYEKDIWEVGRDRKQKAYMYENPEVKPFFQQEARYMLGELDNSSKGEKFYNDQLYYDTNGEMGFFGTKRHTSEEIAYLLDTFNYTYKDIAKGLNAIIEDNGKENNAISKRIEFLIDERLRLGYKDFWFGDKIPPNQEYINLLNEKQINEYNDEAFSNWVQSLTEEDIKQYFMHEEDIAPIPEEYAAVDSESETEVPLYEAKPRKGVVEGQQSMFDETDLDDEGRFNNRQAKQKSLRQWASDLIGNTSTWKDKKIGLQYQVNTLKRNLRDIVRDENGNKDFARADRIYDELQGKYNVHEAQLNRETNRIKQVFKDMKITPAENTYIQMLGEFRHNPSTTLTEDDVKDFYNKNKSKIDTAKVDRAIEESRKLYDSLYSRVNAVLREHGFKEIEYRKGYFPHFVEDKQNFLQKVFNWKTRNDDIPTDIAGLTEEFNPQRSWQTFDKHRKSDVTDYNFTKGLDNYVQGALDWIYHIEDIQKRRAIESEIRYRHSDKGLQAEIDRIRNNPNLTAEEVEVLINEKYKEAKNPLGNFLIDFRNGTNNLAGKKSTADRSMEYATNRHIYSTMTNLSNRVTGNMVAGSVSSALTNFIPITQSWGTVSPFSSLVAMRDTIQSAIRDDGTIQKSAFLTNRLEKGENLYKTGWDKVGDGLSVMMEVVDSFTSQTVWRSKYMENIRQGMSENEAIKNADQFAESVIAGRSRGNMPTIFNSKNPVTKMFTAFQLEVANQYGHMFKDMPQDIGAKSKARLVKGYATMFVGAYVYNALTSVLTGRDSAFDPIRILQEFIGDLGDDEEEPLDVMGNLASNIVDEIPFVGGLMGGGRIPLASAIPYDDPISMVTGTAQDIADKDWANLRNEWSNPLWYGVLPMGGGQLRKTVQGLSMFDDDLPVSGSYTASGKLRFPVEDTFLNKLQAGVFGQYASSNAREYFDRGQAPLGEKQINEYKELDLPIRDYWEYREGLKKQETLEDKFEYIADLGVSVEQKNIMINNVVDRKEKVDMSNYDDFANFEEFDWYTKNTEKYNFLKENGVSYTEYKADDKKKEKYDSDYTVYKNHPEKVALSKAITGNFLEYRNYMRELDEIRADKDSNGKSISGSAKAKKTAYIQSLDLDYGQKIILHRSLYDSKTDMANFNRDIIEYLDSRSDITYEEMVAILEELDMKVHPDGRVTW